MDFINQLFTGVAAFFENFSLQEMISTYGYWALLVGTFLEGETICVLAGIAAQRGFLELPWVVAVAMIGTLCGDQMFFFIGRYKGKQIIANSPKWQARTERVFRLLEKYHTPFIMGYRFLYGIRNPTPFAIGMSNIKTSRFIFLNVLSSFIWALVVASGGYVFGTAIEAFLGDIKKYQTYFFGLIFVVIIVVYFVRKIKKKKVNAISERINSENDKESTLAITYPPKLNEVATEVTKTTAQS